MNDDASRCKGELCDDSMPPRERLAALRIIDANLNRAAEGVRVVEEYCRFGLGDRHLTERCKSLRHRLPAAVAMVPASERLAARDTLGDVGTTIASPADATVARDASEPLEAIATANWQRVQQALRAIEEYAKPLAPEAARAVELLRYESYTLSKACHTTADSQSRLAGARLYVLIDGGSSESAFVERAQALIAAGVHVFQLRDKTLNDCVLLERARLLRRIIDSKFADGESGGVEEVENRTSPSHPLILSPPRPFFIVNDRADIAVLARADGVHIGQEELSVRDVRQIGGPRLLVGVSTHSIEQARQAVLDGANYLGCGPTFSSSTKSFDRFPGLDFLRQVAAEIALPAFAIGGITRENLDDVLSAGIGRIAVAGAVANATDAHRAAADLAAVLAEENEDVER